MLKKPNNYDEIQLNEDFIPIELGGHKGIIMSAEEYTSDVSGNTSLRVCADTAKDDKQPEYFSEQYKSDIRNKDEKKWSNSAIKYVSLKDDDNCVKMLKAFITSVENSNPNYKFDWDKDVSQLKGKKVGLIFGLEEYTNQDGELKTVAKLTQFRSIDKVDNAKIPKVKLLDGSFVDYEEYKNGKKVSTTESDVVEITDEDLLPF